MGSLPLLATRRAEEDEESMDHVPEDSVLTERQESGLNERELAILAFERQWWQHAGAKEQAIRDEFSLSATRYYQLLNALIDRHEALVHDPMLVKRLRRVRAARQRQRSARRLGVRL
nr:DUF3263 domain-containing protein [Cryptosporangium arvum]